MFNMKNTQRFIVTMGLPGSGKSTWAEKFLKENQELIEEKGSTSRISQHSEGFTIHYPTRINKWYHSNRDDLRFEKYKKYNITGAQEKEITRIQGERIIGALNNGRSVLVSDTNLNSKTLEKWKTLIENFNIKTAIGDFEKANSKVNLKVLKYNVLKDNTIELTIDGVSPNILAKLTKPLVELEIQDFRHVDIKDCISQDLKREKSVGKDVIMNMHIERIRPTLYKHSSNKKGKKRAIVFDIDGTLAEKGSRSPYEWDRVDEDTPIEHVFELLGFYINSGYHIIFMSGRMDCCYEKTQRWLIRYLFRYLDTVSSFYSIPEKDPLESFGNFRLLMRKTDDMRKDSIVKREIFMEHIDKHYNVKLCVDDREQVVTMWRDLGIPVLQVADGLF